MEDKRNSGAVKVLAGLAVLFFMVIAGMVGLGMTYFNKTNTVGAISADKPQTEGKEATEKKTEKKSVKIPKTETGSELQNSKTADLSDIVSEAMPSLVAITTEGEKEVVTWFGSQIRKVKGTGTGVVIDKDTEKIYIITSNQVVSGAKSLLVAFENGTTAKASVKGTASYTDLALLEIKLSELDEKTTALVKVIKTGDSDSIKVGQMALAIGNALGYGQSLTVGYISAKDRAVTANDITMKLLQTDAAINPGNLGGALLDLEGRLVGINSVKFSDEAVEGMGYAIPVNTVKSLLEELKNNINLTDTERGYLGIYYREVDENAHSMFNMPFGLYISDVSENGGAFKAGIVAGDIITAVNGYETLKSEAINSIILNKRKGDEVSVTVYRNEDGIYKEKNFTVILAERPEAKN